MSHVGDGGDVNEARREASDWFVRLQADDAGADDWLAFERWLGAGEANEAAFREVEAVWVDLDSALPPARTAEIIPLPVRSRPTPRRWRAPAAVAASVALLVGAAGLMTVFSERQIAQTAPRSDSDRDVPIPGGGLIHLKAGTRLSLRRSGMGIEAAMGPGRAEFTVPHDPLRRFVVRVGDQAITDIGTRFDVREDQAGLGVSVAAGEVAVADADPEHNVLTVNAGQMVVRRRSEEATRLLTATGAPIQKVYDHALLSQVVGDLNRIYARPVRLAPAAANIRFTGALVMDSQDVVLRRLAAFLDLDVTRSPTATVLSKAAKTAQ